MFIQLWFIEPDYEDRLTQQEADILKLIASNRVMFYGKVDAKILQHLWA